MLLTFFTVIAVDLVAVSLLTHKLRVWFPVWLDAHWATRTDPWVVYSQSYFARIFFIPFLSVSLDRHLLRGRPGWIRPVFWTVDYRQIAPSAHNVKAGCRRKEIETVTLGVAGDDSRGAAENFDDIGVGHESFLPLASVCAKAIN
jgi:hypothetical protein